MEIMLTHAAWFGLKGAVYYKYQQAVNKQEQTVKQWVFDQTVKECVGYLDNGDIANLAMCSKQINVLVREDVTGESTKKDKELPRSQALEMLATNACLLNKQKKNVVNTAVSTWKPVQSAVGSMISELQNELVELSNELDELAWSSSDSDYSDSEDDYDCRRSSCAELARDSLPAYSTTRISLLV